MPLHDWTRVDAGLFHAFHQIWTVNLCNELNAGCLPADYFALPEQNVRGPIPDVLTLRLAAKENGRGGRPSGGVATAPVATALPKALMIKETDADGYLTKKNQVTIRHRHGEVIAVVEIVSPGNKASRAEFRAFVEKSADFIRQGVHLLVIDVFPPSVRDPQGLHKAIWDEFIEEEFELPADKRLTIASFAAGPVRRAYLNFVAVGDALPEAPIFLEPGLHVDAPLEASYQAAWTVFPAPMKDLVGG